MDFVIDTFIPHKFPIHSYLRSVLQLGEIYESYTRFQSKVLNTLGYPDIDFSVPNEVQEPNRSEKENTLYLGSIPIFTRQGDSHLCILKRKSL
ncbi:MAG: hypothetical protein GY828_01100 [Candidatus Gracilibacteria bacterium]|nr:hypothetical protein [Candidatus Gracilibacteria bacterium]